MKKELLIIFLICGTFFTSSAALTTIKGKVLQDHSGVISLVMYSDLVSYKKIITDQRGLDPDGSFILNADLDETTYALIEYNFQSAEIFLEPGRAYDITVTPEKSTGSLSYYNRSSLEYTINNETTLGLNVSIQRINMIYNEFLLQSSSFFNDPSRKARVNEVIGKMKAVTEPGTEGYLQDYVKYKAASLELFFRTRSTEKLAKEYLTGQPVLYDHVEYMDYFHIFFEKYLITNNADVSYSRTSELVNGSYTYEEIIAEFRNDPMLDDPRLAELVFLKGLDEMSVMIGFKPERISSLLDQVADRSLFLKHQEIAKNLQWKLNWMKPGMPAPEFDLKDANGNTRHLKDYLDKYLYIAFISLESAPSLAEMNLLADLYPDYGTRVEFVSIIVDDLKPGLKQIAKEYRMEWDLLLLGDNFNLLEEYGATALPVFVMVDPEGNIVNYPAPGPSEDLKSLLESF
jgi:peroxiredoxin